MRIAEIFASFRKSWSRNTMVMSDFRSEVEIRPFRACAMHPVIIVGSSSFIVEWGRYHVPQNVFLVSYKMRSQRVVVTWRDRMLTVDLRPFQRWLQPASEASMRLASDAQYIDFLDISRQHRRIDIVSSVSISLIFTYTEILYSFWNRRQTINGNYGTNVIRTIWYSGACGITVEEKLIFNGSTKHCIGPQGKSAVSVHVHIALLVGIFTFHTS